MLKWDTLSSGAGLAGGERDLVRRRSAAAGAVCTATQPIFARATFACEFLLLVLNAKRRLESIPLPHCTEREDSSTMESGYTFCFVTPKGHFMVYFLYKFGGVHHHSLAEWKTGKASPS